MVEAVRAGNHAPDPSARGLQAADLSGPLRFAGRHWALELSPDTGAIVNLEPRAAGSPHRGLRAGRREGPDGASAALKAETSSLASPAFPLAEVLYTMHSGEHLRNPRCRRPLQLQQALSANAVEAACLPFASCRALDVWRHRKPARLLVKALH